MIPQQQQLEQKRAEACLKTIEFRWDQRENRQVFRKYSQFAKELPLAIQRGGLGQALARILSSSKHTESKASDDMKAYQMLYQDLKVWLTRDEPDAPYRQETDLLHAIMTGGRKRYRLAMAEAIAWLTLHCQLTAIYLNKEGEESV